MIKCVKLQITQPKLHQIKDIGGVLESSGCADSKTVIGIPIWPRFDRENKETSWCISNEQYCIFSEWWSFLSTAMDLTFIASCLYGIFEVLLKYIY